MPNSITQFWLFCEICILTKQVKHISKVLIIKAKTPGKIIYIDLVGLIPLTEYNGSTYELLLTNNIIQATTRVLLRKKSQVKIELPK